MWNEDDYNKDTSHKKGSVWGGSSSSSNSRSCWERYNGGGRISLCICMCVRVYVFMLVCVYPVRWFFVLLLPSSTCLYSLLVFNLYKWRFFPTLNQSIFFMILLIYSGIIVTIVCFLIVPYDIAIAVFRIPYSFEVNTALILVTSSLIHAFYICRAHFSVMGLLCYGNLQDLF